MDYEGVIKIKNFRGKSPGSFLLVILFRLVSVFLKDYRMARLPEAVKVLVVLLTTTVTTYSPVSSVPL